MADQSVSIETITDFLAQHRIAMVGISRNKNDFSVTPLQEFCRRGYDVVPVNPKAEEIGGRRCFARVQDIQPPVEAALLMTSPEVTDVVVNDCAKAGIRKIWMYRAGGKGAVSAGALQFCREHGISVIPGQCPFMFWRDAGIGHRLHGFVRKLTGSFPRHAEVTNRPAA